MSDGPWLLSELGIKLQDIVAGFAGGIVNAFMFQRSDPWSVIGSVVVGSLTAAYLTDYVARFLGTTGQAVPFIVGLTGMALCQGIVSAAKSWRIVKGLPDGQVAPPAGEDPRAG